MAPIGISEFTFGFAFLHEQLNLQPIIGYPVLPSLSAENGLGWDAAFTPLNGTIVYYQFKMSVFLEHGNSEHVQDGTYQTYYRFHLHRNDDYQQHRLLKELADTLAPTYYVAPEVSNANLFGVAYQNGTVSENSRLIPLLECPLIAAGDNDQHYITYTPGNTDFIFHSEAQLCHSSIRGPQIETLYRTLLGQRRELSDEYVGFILEQAEALLARFRPAHPKAIAKPTAKRRIGQLAQFMAANYGLATVILAERS